MFFERDLKCLINSLIKSLFNHSVNHCLQFESVNYMAGSIFSIKIQLIKGGVAQSVIFRIFLFLTILYLLMSNLN